VGEDRAWNTRIMSAAIAHSPTNEPSSPAQRTPRMRESGARLGVPVLTRAGARTDARKQRGRLSPAGAGTAACTGQPPVGAM
jgi:hypothetical protein